MKIFGAAVASAAVAGAGIAGAVGQEFTVAPNSAGGAAPTCANGKLATGGGFRTDIDTAWHQRVLGPQGRRFRVGLKNKTGSEQVGTAIANCAKKDPYDVVKKKAVFEITPAEPGVTKTLKAKCPRGTKLAGGGYASSSPDDESSLVLESRPVGRKWRVTATQKASGDYALKVRAICDTRTNADYEVERQSVSDLAGRTARGINVILQFTLEPTCEAPSRPTAGGFALLGEFRTTRWSTIAPEGRAYVLIGRQGHGPGGIEGDAVGYAVCRK